MGFADWPVGGRVAGNLLLLMVLALIVAWPREAPPVSVRMVGDALVIRAPSLPDGEKPEVLLGGHPLAMTAGRGVHSGSWIGRPLPGDAPAPVRLRLDGGEISLGDLRSQLPAIRIDDLAPGRRLEVTARRPVVAWWAGGEQVTVHLPPGPGTLPAPPRGPFELHWEEGGIESSRRVDLAPVLRRAADRLEAGPPPGKELTGQEETWREEHQLLVGPSPRSLLAPWRPELFSALPEPERVRRVWGRLDEWATLEVRAGQSQPRGCSPPEPGPWRVARSSVPASEQGDRVPLTRGEGDLGITGLIHDAALGATLNPPGAIRKRFFLHWPGRPPAGDGPLRVDLRIRGVEQNWLRFLEMKVNGDGFRITLPPAGCPRGEEYLYFSLHDRAEPDAGLLMQVEVWGDPEQAPRGELVEAWVSRSQG